jgi:lipopolysaccharide/colanic/teichoic acid biosynthesis glycosyltransferase
VINSGTNVILFKRVFDIFFSIIGLVILCPLFIFIMIWIKVDSPGTPFFRQKRVGKGGVLINVLKFRTMKMNIANAGAKITVGNDKRVTRCGKFLRKYKIDEFPQLWNVLIGEMSFVGPRPEVQEYVSLYGDEIRRKVLSVKPGITDWASLEYHDESSILAQADDPIQAYIHQVMPDKLKYCVKYTDNNNLWIDFKIILLTLKKIFLNKLWASAPVRKVSSFFK